MSNVKLLPSISRSDPEKEFELLKQIGSGPYGEVYKARNHTNTCSILSMQIMYVSHFVCITPSIL